MQSKRTAFPVRLYSLISKMEQLVTYRLNYLNIGFARMHGRLIAYIIMEYSHDIAVHLFVI